MAYRQFVVPRNIFYGPGAIEALADIPGKRVLIVTDSGVASLGLIERVKNILSRRKTEIRVFDKVKADPSNEIVWEIFSLAQDFKPDLFIGLGGGSPMDAGKAGFALYEHPDLAGMSTAEVKQELPNRELHVKARYVAIPTTSGTGSEVTRVAVVTDNTVEPHMKVSWYALQLVPDVAIADPELTSSMPPEVTANTGYDALVHATECYVLSEQSDIIDSLTTGATRLVMEWLPEAVADGEKIQARSKMHLAALQAGMAFSNGTLWLVHVTAHDLGSTLGMPHGLTCAFMLSPSFAYLYRTHKERLVNLAESLGIEGKNDETKVNKLIDSLDDLKKKIGIPLAIKDTGLDESTFGSVLGQIVERCTEQLNIRAVSPGLFTLSSAEVKELYIHAWNGTRAELK
ncbi:iron-containing alcohol dehydrogenase [Chloroflexota bacterium]